MSAAVLTQEDRAGGSSEGGTTVALPYDRITEWLLFGQIITATIFQKIAISIGGTQIFFGLFLMVGLTLFGFLSGRLEIRKDNMAIYMILIGTMALTQLLGSYQFSIMSMLLLYVLHMPYAFGVSNGRIRPNIHLVFYQKLMAVLAVLGFIQYFAQYVIGPELAFPLDHFLPDSVIMQGFHGLNPTSSNENYFKSTGVFLQEPSNFSQLLAISIVIEMMYFKNWKRILIYLAGIAVTFSGTGLIILLVLVPVYLVQNRRFITLLAMFVMLVAAPLWMPAVGLENTMSRATEFTNQHSSGYARFLSIFRTLDTFIVNENDTLFLGRGAGSAVRIFQLGSPDYAAHVPTWGKLIFEYGMLGGLVYYFFIGYLFWRARISGYVKAAILLQFLLLGEYVLAPTVHAFILAIVAWPSRGPQEPDEAIATIETEPQLQVSSR